MEINVAIRFVRILAEAEKFDIANLYINSALRPNRLFLCPLDVLNILYCHQPVPCTLVT